MQKNQLTELQKHFERYCIVLPVFEINRPKQDITLINSCFLPILVSKRAFKPTAIKKANQFVSFKIVDNELLDILRFLIGATSLEFFSQSP